MRRVALSAGAAFGVPEPQCMQATCLKVVSPEPMPLVRSECAFASRERTAQA